MVVCIWNASHLWVPWHLVMMEPWLAFHFCVIFNVSGWPSANQCNTNFLVCIGSTIECWKRQDAAQVVAQVQYWSMTYFLSLVAYLHFDMIIWLRICRVRITFSLLCDSITKKLFLYVILIWQEVESDIGTHKIIRSSSKLKKEEPLSLSDRTLGTYQVISLHANFCPNFISSSMTHHNILSETVSWFLKLVWEGLGIGGGEAVGNWNRYHFLLV